MTNTTIKLVSLTISLLCLASTQPSYAQEQQQETTLKADTTMRYSLDSAAVVSTRRPLLGNGLNYIYTPERAASVISVIGEPDIMRQVATLPGVSFGIEGSLGLFIRGGNSNNCRLEFDGVPIYNGTHLLGIFSSIHPEIVSSAQLKTGGFSASTGDYTSGVLNATLKTGPVDKFKQVYSFSPYIESFYLETPGKFSVKIGGRYSPLLQIANFATKKFMDSGYIDGLLFDLIGNISYQSSPKNLIYASGFYGKDTFDSYTYETKEGEGLGWDSWMIKLGDKFSFNDKTNMEISAYWTGSESYTIFKDLDFQSDKSNKSVFKNSNKVSHISAKAQLNHSFNEHSNLDAGYEYQSRFNQDLHSVFADYNHLFWDKLNVQLGLRYALKKNLDYHFLAEYDINNHYGIQLSLDKTCQYFHVLEGTPAGGAMNLIVPITDQFPEEIAKQAYLGFYTAHQFNAGDFFGKMKINASIGGYYKDMSNMASYTSSFNIFKYTNMSWEFSSEVGIGKSYGLETSLNIDSDRLSFNAAYTLSKTTRKFPTINKGEVFPFQFDRPHILNLQLDLETFNKNQHFYINMNYASGSRVTIADGQYPAVPFPHIQRPEPYYESLIYLILMYNRWTMSSVNQHKLRDNFRLDVGYNFKFDRPKTTHELSISIYNVLNNHNPFMIFLDGETNQWKQVSLLPIMPSIRWRLSFK